MKFFRAFALTALLCSSLLAQGELSCEIGPNPAMPGQTLSFVFEATLPGSSLQSACLYDVRMGSPTGPNVLGPTFCILIIPPVGPGSPYTIMHPGTTNSQPGGPPFAPGTYYVVMGWYPPTGPQQTAVFPFRIDDPAAPPLPVLSSAGGLAGGTTTTFTLACPTEPGAFYVAAASMTTNTGWFLPGGGAHVALDMDSVFALSYPLAYPGVFNGFSGNLDSSGSTSGISISVPPGFVPPGSPGAIQAALIDALGNIKLSNALTFSIQ